jgi:hypothetical protein
MRLSPVDQYFESFMTQQPYPRCPIESYSAIALYGNAVSLIQGGDRQINRVLPTTNNSSLENMSSVPSV